MELFEKVEKLVEKTGVSYEEAKRALQKADGDLLDAMIILEKEGKAAAPKHSTYSTQYEDQTQYVSVAEKVQENEKNREEGSGKERFKEFCRKVWHKLSHNYFVIDRKGSQLIKVPCWLLVLALIFFWWAAIILVIAGLFLGCTYRIVGEDDLSAANKVFDKASKAAERVKEEFRESTAKREE